MFLKKGFEIWALAAAGHVALAACGGNSREQGVPNGATGGTSGSAGAASGGKGASSGAGGTAGKGGSTSGGSGGASGGAGGGAGKGGGGAGGASGGSGGQAENGGAAGSTGGSAGVSGEAGAGAGGMLSDLEAIDETVRAFCDAAADCCAEQGVPAMLEDCDSLYPMDQPAVASVMNGDIAIDRAALARCQAAYAEGPDRCNMNVLVEACRGVFVGRRAAEERCLGGYDCDRSENTMTCLITDTSVEQPEGVCTVVPHAALDEPCVSSCRSGSDCSSTTYGVGETNALCFEDDGLYCQYLSPGSACRPIVGLDEPCSSFDECGSRAFCDTTCKPLSDLGEACGRGCISKYMCGPEDTCIDPSWATEWACSGHAPGP